jgi:peptidoglycan/LPS O-acetylase OafA/YrhL
VTTPAAESPRVAAHAPDAVAPFPGNPRFPLLDGLRAIAAGSILITHVASDSGFNTGNPLGAYTARLNAGVALFFVISGFLLYRPFLAARFEGRPLPCLRDYARRRVLRIVPAYWLAVTILGIAVGLCGVFTSQWWVYYLFLQSYSSSTVICGIGPAWSLSIEVAFYCALPLWVLLMARAQRGRPRQAMVRIEAAGLLVIGLASLGLRTWWHAKVGHQTSVDASIAGNVDWFCWGMALALASVALHEREHLSRAGSVVVRHPWVPWALAGFLLWLDSTQLGMVRSFPPVYTNAQWLAEHLIFPAMGFLLALPAVFGDPRHGMTRRVLGCRPLAWFGLVSYGVFLWHQPLMRPLMDAGAMHVLPGHQPFLSLLLVVTAVSLAVAALSYYLVERPILRFKDGGRRRPPGTSARSQEPAPVVAG